MSATLRRIAPAPAVRHVHLGLGSFFRAHQAWYTHRAPDGAAWGIAAFSGRSAGLAERLSAQHGLYTLATRAPGGERYEVITSLAEAHPASDHAAWLARLADPQVAILTLTVTEAAYLRGPDGALAVDRRDVQADVAVLREGRSGTLGALGTVSTVPGRIVAGLLARRAAGAGPIAVVPCDNLPDNATAVARVVADLAELVDPSLRAWIDEHVSYVATMVDRITPEPTAADVARVAEATGTGDTAPVVTEPFSEWVLAGDFPGGRPAWDRAGATFTDDVGPYEDRKLGLLNGAHSLLAYLGSLRGHEVVAEAIVDPTVRAAVERWWDECALALPFSDAEIVAYREALVERFANPAIRHRLAQIGTDGSQKIPARILPTVRRVREAGSIPGGAATALAAWVASVRSGGVATRDARAADLAELAGRSPEASTRGLLGLLDADLADDDVLVAAVASGVADLG